MSELTAVTPVDYFKIYLTFGTGDIRVISANSDPRLWFLSYPDQLKSFRFDPSGISWSNGVSLAADELFACSQETTEPERAREFLTLGSRNHAPSNRHPNHDVWYVLVHPFPDPAFALCESIGGGHMEMGGCMPAKIRRELLKTPNWEEHFSKSGCEWAIPLLRNEADEHLMKQLVHGICHPEEVNPATGSASGSPAQANFLGRLFRIFGG